MPIAIQAIKSDIKGRYLILVVKIMNKCLTFVNLYVPPLFTFSHLADMLQATFDIAECRVFILGDFNAVADPAMDRLRASPGTPAPLAGWLSTYGFQDVWQFLHPDTKEYSCFSETHKSMSRIDCPC